jgi:ketosteroid isomerase-like protein
LYDENYERRRLEMSQSIEPFLSDWADAELSGDTVRLDQLLTDDFQAVGPLGFVLPKAAWLARRRPGSDLTYKAFGVDEVQARNYGETAIVIARHTAKGDYQGQPIPEALRVTMALINSSGNMRLAGAHMSFIAGTPGAPPIPGGSSRISGEVENG